MLPARGGRGAKAPAATGNTVLASPAMPPATWPGSLGVYIIILFLIFFFCETVLCFLFFFPSVKKSEAFFLNMPISTIDILIYLL